MKTKVNGNIHANQAAHDLPYKEEMQELIEKEKHLLQLKVLEQQREADDWRAKYESIVNKVGDDAGKTGDFRALEFVARVDSHNSSNLQESASKNIDVSSEGMQQLLLDLRYKWVLDMSAPSLGVRSIKQDLLKAVNNEIFSVRGVESNQVTIFMAERCDLEDSHAITLGSMMSKNNLSAFSVAYNNLGPSFFVQFMNSLRARRKTPQYINMSGNVNMANLDLSPMLKNLTDSTWGIICSLQDCAHGQLSDRRGDGPSGHASTSAKKAGQSVASKGTRRSAASNKSLANDLYSDSQQPEMALSFLKHLHTTMDPAAASAGANAIKKGGTASKIASRTSAESKGGAANTSGGIIRTSNLTTLAVFGLTCNFLCTESISKLGEVLDVAAPSLTDLDLSFAYVGKFGSKILHDALASPSSQMVRLGLAGNNIGDAGAAEIGMGLRKNRTLTFLDVRSNNIEPPGLRSLCYALTGAEVTHVGFDGAAFKEPKTSPNNVLSHIDIRGNFLPETSVHSTRLALKDWGLCVALQSGPQYRPMGGTDDTDRSISMRTDACEVAPGKETMLLFQLPAKMVSEFSVADKDGVNNPSCNVAQLYSIDLKYINTHFNSRGSHHIKVAWSMRPAAERTSLEGVSVAEAWLSAPNSLGWEILLETSTSTKVVASGRLAVGSCLYNQHGADAQWARCQALLSSDYPLKGSLLVRAVAFDDGATKVPSAIEFAECVLLSEPSTEYCVEGGDYGDWVWTDASAVSLSGGGGDECGSLHSLYERIAESCILQNFEDYSLLRVLKHASDSEGSALGVSLSWSSKLIAGAGANGGYHGKGLGYEWVVLLEQALCGGIVEVARGGCDPVDIRDEDGDSIADTAISLKLHPWRWVEMQTTIGHRVSSGDKIVLLARTKSLYEGSFVKDDALSKPACSVAIKDCSLRAPTPLPSSTTNEVAVGVFARHNAPLAF